MGEKTALQIMNDALAELSLAQTTTILGTDPQIVSLFRFLNKTGDDLVKRKDWPETEREFIIEFGAPLQLAATITDGSASVTVSSTALLSALGAEYWAVSGSGMQIACRIASIDSPTTLTLTETADINATTTLSFTQDTFDLPDDWKRDSANTHWDRRNQWRLIGPIGAIEEQWRRSGIVPSGPRLRFRNVGTPLKCRIFPPPTASGSFPGTLVRFYYSKWFALDAGGSAKRQITANTDTFCWADDQVIIDGIKWRYWQSKGLPYLDYMKDYYEGIDIQVADSEGSPILSTNRRESWGSDWLLSTDAVQDGNFPGE